MKPGRKLKTLLTSSRKWKRFWKFPTSPLLIWRHNPSTSERMKYLYVCRIRKGWNVTPLVKKVLRHTVGGIASQTAVLTIAVATLEAHSNIGLYSWKRRWIPCWQSRKSFSARQHLKFKISKFSFLGEYTLIVKTIFKVNHIKIKEENLWSCIFAILLEAAEEYICRRKISDQVFLPYYRRRPKKKCEKNEHFFCAIVAKASLILFVVSCNCRSKSGGFGWYSQKAQYSRAVCTFSSLH